MANSSPRYPTFVPLSFLPHTPRGIRGLKAAAYGPCSKGDGKRRQRDVFLNSAPVSLSSFSSDPPPLLPLSFCSGKHTRILPQQLAFPSQDHHDVNDIAPRVIRSSRGERQETDRRNYVLVCVVLCIRREQKDKRGSGGLLHSEGCQVLHFLSLSSRKVSRI